MSGTAYPLELYVLLGTYQNTAGRIARVVMPRGSAAAPVVGTLAYEVASPSAQVAVEMREEYNTVDVVDLPSRSTVRAGERATFAAPEADLLVAAGIATILTGWGFYWDGGWGGE